MDAYPVLKQMQQMQAEIERIQNQVAEETVEASAGGGAVKVKANGARQIVSIEIKPEAIDPDDPEMLQDLIVVAVNEALGAAERLLQDRLDGLMGGLSGIHLPGL